jgi:hypothetical protein
VDGEQLEEGCAREAGAAAEEPVDIGVGGDEDGHAVPAVDLARHAGLAEQIVEELELRVPVQDLGDVEAPGDGVRRVSGAGIGVTDCREEEEE